MGILRVGNLEFLAYMQQYGQLQIVGISDRPDWGLVHACQGPQVLILLHHVGDKLRGFLGNIGSCFFCGFL